MELNSDTFRIAKIINDYTFIINGGTKHKIKINDKFKIMQEDEIEVADPETNEIIGKYQLNKGVIVVEQLFENFSICKTETYESVNAISQFSRMMNSTTTQHKKLEVDMDQVTGGLTPDAIKIGDIVKKIND